MGIPNQDLESSPNSFRSAISQIDIVGISLNSGISSFNCLGHLLAHILETLRISSVRAWWRVGVTKDKLLATVLGILTDKVGLE